MVTVLQFNALADSLSLAGGFSRAPPECLTWEARRQPLLEEIVRHDPDIVCLQEIDKFQEWFEPQLKQHGYTGIFKQKGGESKDGSVLPAFMQNVYRRTTHLNSSERPWTEDS